MRFKKVGHVAEKYKEVQNKACDILDEADGKALFSKDAWTKEIGNGLTRVMAGGRHIEKAAINFSHVTGNYTERMAKMAGKSGKTFSATGVSSIIHPVNPFVPITHMNIRYFETDSGLSWFGGGIDLTPHYIDKKEASYFHKEIKKVCDQSNTRFYTKFKKWADDYFFITHRNETRGIGGIFFDQLEPEKEYGFDLLLEFTLNIGKLYPILYAELMEQKKDTPYTEQHKAWQLLRRGRYIEFNLVYDRGTKFGLDSGGNTESILVSMPPMASWIYDQVPKAGSAEKETLDMLKKDIDWLTIK